MRKKADFAAYNNEQIHASKISRISLPATSVPVLRSYFSREIFDTRISTSRLIERLDRGYQNPGASSNIQVGVQVPLIIRKSHIVPVLRIVLNKSSSNLFSHLIRSHKR